MINIRLKLDFYEIIDKEKEVVYSDNIKARIKKNIKNDNRYNGLYQERNSSIIFDNPSDNFLKSTYDNIKSNPLWFNRTKKPLSSLKDGTLEMQSSNSSDALLMNIFCHPKFDSWKGVHDLLEIDNNASKEFGWNPIFENENPSHRTEIDLKIGNHIFESKLTERDFTSKSETVIHTYSDFFTVFDTELLNKSNNEYAHYQLIRNVLTAYKYDFYFSILIDSSRIDLIKELINVITAIKIPKLRKRINFYTWQEIVDSCGEDLKEYIKHKYF